MREIGFIGVHVLSPQIFGVIEERGAFSIIEAYMRLIGDGHRLATFDIARVRVDRILL